MFVISGHMWSTSNRNNLSLGSWSSLFWCRWQYYNYFSCKSRYLYLRKLHTFVTLRHTDLPVDCYLSRYMYSVYLRMSSWEISLLMKNPKNFHLNYPTEIVFFFRILADDVVFLSYFIPLYLCRLRKATCPIKSPLDLNLKS